MSITSLTFLMFVLVLTIVYFVVPKKYQWTVLLGASLIFYLSTGIENILYILITALSTYAATRYMQNVTDVQKTYLKDNKEILSREERNAIKHANNKKRKKAMVAVLLLNLGLLGFFKYSVFFLETVNAIIPVVDRDVFSALENLIMPLGISFYTFQTMGYLVDIYWEKYDAEKNFFRVLLFVSFFPQITQGPISDYKSLTKELFSEHEFTYKNYSYGIQRMMWGFYKKIAVADLIAPALKTVFRDYSSVSGLATLIWAFLYSVQLYADFSGYMDIVCGMSEIWGIRLTENFNRPYFSKSVTEYWRRWHMSLGAWFKTYLYYPIGVSKWNKNFSKKIQKLLGLKAQTMAATTAMIAVWSCTGLWHGATWGYVLWGGINGLFVIMAMWLEDFYEKSRTTLHINPNNFFWRAFQVARTFTIVTFIKLLPATGSIKQGAGFIANIFINMAVPFSLSEIMLDEVVKTCIVFSGILLMLIMSLIQRKGSVRDWLQKKPAFVRWIVFVAIFMITIIAIDPVSPEAGGFMYAKF